MYGTRNVRVLSALLLTGVMAVLSGYASNVVAKGTPVHAPTDATKPAVGTLQPGQKLTADQLAKHIDKLILAQLQAEKTDASPLCTDEEFLRRVYLDITGKIPTADKAVAFLDSKESDKRSKLIDELLASKDYGTHMSDVWQALLLPRNSDNRRLMQYYPTLVKWLEEQFNANTKWDKMVNDILTAKGDVEKNGPVVYWLANPTADKVTDNVTKVFMGVQLQCAQCHNHPFTDWKQDDYWSTAAFFLRVRPDVNPKAAVKQGKKINVDEGPAKKGKKGMLPESAKILPPKYPKGDKAAVRANEPLRPHLADWMTSAKNPFFGRAMVNRTWGQLFGRGFVAPVDDIHEGNPASHPPLLADLTQQFAANEFDLKYLIRAICNSQTYQRSSKPHGNNNEAGPELFARMAMKPLTPEQMYDALTQLMGPARPGMRGGKAGGGAPALRGLNNPREAFVTFFAAEEGADPTEYHTGIPQVLRLMNSPQFNSTAALGPIMRTVKAPGEGVEKIYLTVLSRRPTAEEVDRVREYVRKSKEEPRQALAGLLWALMNSSEFAMNR